VLDLHQQGLAQKLIAQRLGLSTKTIRRYLKAGQLPEITRQRRPGVLAPYLDYLQARWQVGCHNGAQLWREIKKLGYAGGQTMVADWVATQRKQLNAQQQGGQSRKRPWSARAVAWLLVKPPEKLKPNEKATVERVLQASDPVSRAYHFGQAFLRLVRQRYHKALSPWLTAALESDISDLRQFAKSLVQDQAAVQAALSLSWSNGQVEGQVNRLKLIKRQMYGRAKFDLLKLRFLAA
jgi:transposase